MSSCADSSISRFRIFSALATAIADTWPRNSSTGLVGLLLDLGLGGGELTFTLLDAGILALGHDFVGAGVSLVEDARRLLARFGNDLVSLRFGLGQLLLALVRSSEAFLDLLLPLFEGVQDRWPEMNFMQNQTNTIIAIDWADESQIDVHVMLLRHLLNGLLQERALTRDCRAASCLPRASDRSPLNRRSLPAADR